MLGCSNDAVKKTLVDCPLCILTYFFRQSQVHLRQPVLHNIDLYYSIKGLCAGQYRV